MRIRYFLREGVSVGVMAKTLDLQDFLLRGRVLKLYRQALRITRRAPVDSRGELRSMIRQELENNRHCNERQRTRFLLSEGLERLKRLDEMLDMQGHRVQLALQLLHLSIHSVSTIHILQLRNAPKYGIEARCIRGAAFLNHQIEHLNCIFKILVLTVTLYKKIVSNGIRIASQPLHLITNLQHLLSPASLHMNPHQIIEGNRIWLATGINHLSENIMGTRNLAAPAQTIDHDAVSIHIRHDPGRLHVPKYPLRLRHITSSAPAINQASVQYNVNFKLMLQAIEKRLRFAGPSLLAQNPNHYRESHPIRRATVLLHTIKRVHRLRSQSGPYVSPDKIREGLDRNLNIASFHQVDHVPSQIELPHLSSEVDHLVVGLRFLLEPVAGRGPVEECNCLDQGDAVADTTALLDHAADDGGRYRMDGGDLGEVLRESRDYEGGVWGMGVGIRIGVVAVVVFDEGVEFVGD
ncbi:hypothetical protein DVH24_020075 [Malus domestica]|uniref:LYR motif-containing protein 2 n=2 Tax=Malus TaxID=3749 RepID=A0A498JB82_MALDO|nr:hypothetical protein DVH24_020075 [Malus domestica]